ncbi:MAG: Hsp20 family protein [Clostridiaceae bacterium]
MADLFPMLTGPSLMPEDRFFRKFFDSLTDHKNSLAIDLKDEGDHFLLEADMPGIGKENIKIHYKDNVLTIQTEKTEEKKEENEEKRYMMRERYSSSSKRQIILENVKADEITAALDNGILRITLPKKEKEPETNVREIEIK